MGKTNIDDTYWYVFVTLNLEANTFRVGQISSYDSVHLPFIPNPYVLVTAADEIGAFHEAHKVLARLNFSLPTDE